MAEQTEPVTVRANKEIVNGFDALATALDRSRNYLMNLALQQFLERNAWQVDRIQAGVKDVEAGRVTPAEKVFDEIAKEHGWQLNQK